MFAAIAALRQLNARRIIVATPTIARSTYYYLRKHADEVVTGQLLADLTRRLQARGDEVRAAHVVARPLVEVLRQVAVVLEVGDVPAEVRGQMQFHVVGSVDQVLALALEPTGLSMAA